MLERTLGASWETWRAVGGAKFVGDAKRREDDIFNGLSAWLMRWKDMIQYRAVKYCKVAMSETDTKLLAPTFLAPRETHRSDVNLARKVSDYPELCNLNLGLHTKH